jgi:Domain of Unknown Function (DUF748)
MKRNAAQSPGAAGDSSKMPMANTAPRPKKHRRLRRWGIFFLILALILTSVRIALPSLVRDYVNRTLDRNPMYSGKIGEVQIHLYRGAYSIQDISISKTSGNVPVPFFAAKRVEFALQWNALLHRRLVALVYMEKPELNFVDAPSDSEAQSGAGAPWMQMIRDLSPFKVNRAVIRDGTVHFRAYQKDIPVDVYLSQVDGTVDNLGNIYNQTTPLVSTVQATAMVMDQAKVEFKMTLDPFSYKPTFHLLLRVLNLDVVKLNGLALAYGKFDFKRGWLDLVVEADAKEGVLKGYVKPLFRDLKVFSPAEDLKENPLLAFWKALVGAVTFVFKNQPRDQFGTLIPFSGDMSAGTHTDILATVGNLLRNAFVRAYLPRPEGSPGTDEGLQFEPPEITDPISPTESQ